MHAWKLQTNQFYTVLAAMIGSCGHRTAAAAADLFFGRSRTQSQPMYVDISNFYTVCTRTDTMQVLGCLLQLSPLASHSIPPTLSSGVAVPPCDPPFIPAHLYGVIIGGCTVLSVHAGRWDVPHETSHLYANTQQWFRSASLAGHPSCTASRAGLAAPSSWGFV